jgi:hypothetical protein
MKTESGYNFNEKCETEDQIGDANGRLVSERVLCRVHIACEGLDCVELTRSLSNSQPFLVKTLVSS